jgi:hypothetical protein
MERRIIVPKYWSESKTKRIVNGSSYTIKRFGWADTSQEEAKSHAEERLEQALKTLTEKGDVRRIDHKVSYNGAEGIPIREEVVCKHDEVVISRNSYGALCLNTPDVMFADIDLDYEPSSWIGASVVVFISIIGGAFAFHNQSWGIFFGSVVLGMFASSPISKFVNNKINEQKGGLEKEAIDRFKQVSDDNPDLHMRIYKTTMGYRILFMEDTHDPKSDSTQKILRSLKSDSTYIQMCRNQNCFRARVSPKPWRIGIDRLRPRPGVWPVREELMPERQTWIEEYTKKSTCYSTCAYLMTLGSRTVNQKAEFVRKLHDELCKSDLSENVLA